MKRGIIALVLVFSLYLPIAMERAWAEPTWYLENSGTTSQLSGVDFIGDDGWAVGASGTIKRTYNGGKNWYPQTSGTTNYLYSIDIRSTGTVANGWVVGASGVIRHTDDGSSWMAQTSGTTNNLYAIRVSGDLQNGWIVGDAATFLRSTNGGTTWGKITVKYPFFFTTRTVTEPLRGVDFVDTSRGWVVGATWTMSATVMASIMHTTDGGVTWQYQGITVPSDGRVAYNYVDFVDANSGWVVGYSGVILHTDDGGTHWSKQTSGTTKALNAVRFVSTNVGWAVGDDGLILYTANGGTTWIPQTSGTTRDFYDVDAQDSVHAWAVGQVGVIDRYASFDFNIARSPSTRTIAKGSSTTYTVYVERSSGAPSPVLLSVTGLPAGTSQSFSNNNINPDYTSTLTLIPSAATPTGSFTITMQGQSGALTRSKTATLVVTAAPDFNLDVTPSTLEINAGTSGSATVTISSLVGFSSPITLSLSGLPSGVAPAFTTNPITPPAGGTTPSTLTLNVASSVVTGTYPITIQGTSGALTHTDSINLIISAPPPLPPPFDFAIVVAGSGSVSMLPGATATYELRINLISGSAQIVALSASGLPVGTTASFTTQSGLPSYITTLLVATSSSSPMGSYSILVTAAGGSATHQQVLTLELATPITTTAATTSVATATTTSTVTATITTTSTGTITSAATSTATTAPTYTATTTPIIPGRPCLIATATYGSELSPEVQLLRNFRDECVLKTFAGTQFMHAFNAFYYSFSPTVASAIADSPFLSQTARVLLYPLIAALRASSTIFQSLNFSPESAVVISGVFASTLVGVTYLAPLMLLMKLRKRTAGAHTHEGMATGGANMTL